MPNPRMLALAVLIALSGMLILFRADAQDGDTVEVLPVAETAPSPADGATNPAIWIHPNDPAQSLIIASDDNFGMMVYDLTGAELQTLPLGEISSVDLRYNFPFGDDETITLVAGGAKDTPYVVFLTVDPITRNVSEIARMEVGLDVSGLCLYQSPLNREYYVFVNNDDGDFEQWQIRAATEGQLELSLAREFSVGSETENCVVDDERSSLYVAEEDVALWRYGAEPESGNTRVIVDLTGRRGNFTEQVEGLAVYYGADGNGYLLGADEVGDRIVVLDRKTGAFVGAFEIGATDTVDGVQEPGGIAVVGLALNADFPQGLLVTTDDVHGENTNFKIVSWETIAAALDLTSDPTYDPRLTNTATRPVNLVPQVNPTIETEPVASGIDAADDPAIWVHPTDPNLSTIIGTNKTVAGGMVVYDLDGTKIQEVPMGRINNADLRYSFPLDGALVDIVVGSNRTDNSIEVYTINPDTRTLEDAAARVLESNLTEVYGICLYRSALSGKFYAIVNSAKDGGVEQWELFDNGAGQIDGEVVRTFSVGNQTEGCVADDERGVLYIGEEASGFWKYGAEPNDDSAPILIDTTGEGGNLTADVEGIALYNQSDGTGYIIVSSQGNSTFVVYAREGDNAYLGTFQITPSETVDGVSGTDGIDVISTPLGDAFPHGVFVAQDDRNISPVDNQNFKLVDWQAIADALGLEVDTEWNPRGFE